MLTPLEIGMTKSKKPMKTVPHYFQKISEFINFERSKGPKIITYEIFCIRKFKCPKLFKHYFSIENLYTEHLNINE